MKRLFTLTMILLVVFSCTNEPKKDAIFKSNFIKEKNIVFDCKTFKDKVTRGDTISFSEFDDLFPYSYQNLKLNEDYVLWNNPKEAEIKLNEKVCSYLFHCYNKENPSKIEYWFSFCVDENCEILSFMVTKELGETIEYYLTSNDSILKLLDDGSLNLNPSSTNKKYEDFIKKFPRSTNSFLRTK